MWLFFTIWIVSLFRVDAVGEYIPQRDNNGKLLSKQCHGSTGYCWCVDSSGERSRLSGPGVPLECPDY
jgi:hypothetical protein